MEIDLKQRILEIVNQGRLMSLGIIDSVDEKISDSKGRNLIYNVYGSICKKTGPDVSL